MARRPQSYERTIGFDQKGAPILQTMIAVAPHEFVNAIAFERLGLAALREAAA